MAAYEQQVAPSPIGRKQPQRGDEFNEPESPVPGTSEVLGGEKRHYRLNGKQAYQAEENIRAYEKPAVQGQRHD
jgi:hypothetical protein